MWYSLCEGLLHWVVSSAKSEDTLQSRDLISSADDESHLRKTRRNKLAMCGRLRKFCCGSHKIFLLQVQIFLLWRNNCSNTLLSQRENVLLQRTKWLPQQNFLSCPYIATFFFREGVQRFVRFDRTPLHLLLHLHHLYVGYGSMSVRSSMKLETLRQSGVVNVLPHRGLILRHSSLIPDFSR